SSRTHRRPRTISRLDGSVRLNKDPRIVFGQLTYRRAHDTHADGIIHPYRAAKSKHKFTLFEIPGATKRQMLQARRFNFQKREIEQAIHADELPLENGTLPLVYTIYFDANGARPCYYVRVGHDVPVGGDDHTRACAALSRKNVGPSMPRRIQAITGSCDLDD